MQISIDENIVKSLKTYISVMIMTTFMEKWPICNLLKANLVKKVH